MTDLRPVSACLLDTNVLLRLSQPGGPYDEVVVAAVERLVTSEVTLLYSLQNTAEFWNVCTRPRERNGLGLDVIETDRRLHVIERHFRFLPESEAVYPEWRRIVMECHVSGVQVHDARLAALMVVNRISHLLTLNPRDFARYSGVIPLHPQDVRG